MKIVVYTTSNCIYCTRVKQLFDKAELEYTSYLVGEDITKEALEKKYPLAKGYPYVIIDGKEIPGLQATAKYLVDKGYASKLRSK